MNKFGALILTHGRPNGVLTHDTLRRAGYTGDIYFVVDDEDRTVSEYRQRYGEDRVVMFNKQAMADLIDEGNNFDNRKVIVHARNASFDIAHSLGLTHFIQLDDDYYFFGYRNGDGAKKITRLDEVFAALVEFMERTPTVTIALSQGGDHIGGFGGVRMKRKAMNSFVCSTARRFWFVGSINEDVNTYVVSGSRGGLFFTFTGLQLDQKDTQSRDGGMTAIYLERGTYVKSFSTVMMHPSSVRVAMMSTKFRRFHHLIDWGATVPKIVPKKFAR